MNEDRSESGHLAELNVNRFEFFSDAIIAIAMTLLVIELKVPEEKGSALFGAIVNLWPHFLICANSFLVISVLWLNHHALFHFVKQVDRNTAILNLFLLMSIAFVPFSTALMGHHYTESSAVVFYGLSLAATGILYNFLWLWVVKRFIRPGGLLAPSALRSAQRWSIAYPVLYSLAATLALVSPVAGIGCYIAISLYYLLPSTIDAQIACFKTSRSASSAMKPLRSNRSPLTNRAVPSTSKE
jgi:uncharacterized membrane protein